MASMSGSPIPVGPVIAWDIRLSIIVTGLFFCFLWLSSFQLVDPVVFVQCKDFKLVFFLGLLDLVMG